MSDETGVPAVPEGQESTLELISSLRAQDAPVTEEATESTPPEAAKPETPAEETPPVDEDKEAEARRNALLREIAIDPVRTHHYAYGKTQPESKAEEAFTLPFDAETYDPTNLEHQQALMDARLQQIGGPLFEAIEKINQRHEQEQAEKQQQVYQQNHEQAQQKTVAFLDTYVPGFQGITEKLSKGEEPTVQEEAVFNVAVNLESAYLHAYSQNLMEQNPGVSYQVAYNYVLQDVKTRAEIAQKVGPVLKEKAAALGLVAQPKTAATLTPEQKKVIKQESYVESSNAVPVNTTSSFEKALSKHDSVRMIAALRQARE